MSTFVKIRMTIRHVPYVLALAVLCAAGGSAYADKGTQHQMEQPRPSYFGVSGSNINFLVVDANSYCYAGTLGALVKDNSNSKYYILSNNHVLAEENMATVGEAAIQPGLLDENGDSNSCSPAGTNYSPYIVGALSRFVTLDFDGEPNLVDAAIAEVGDCSEESCMDPYGRILDIGGIQNTTPFDSATFTLSDLIGLAVQKSGRTTGLTTGTIGAVGANLNVTYDFGTAHFEDQLLVSGDRGAFIKAGDSGSLMVTRPTDNASLPQAVGLLFASSITGVAIANGIDNVLDALNVSMVGCVDSSQVDCTDTGTTSGGGGGGGGGGSGSHGGGGGSHGPAKNGLGAAAASGLEIAAEVRERHESSLMANPDVVGTGLSLDTNGDPVIQVYTRDARRLVGKSIPSELEGVKVRVIVTGEFRAM